MVNKKVYLFLAFLIFIAVVSLLTAMVDKRGSSYRPGLSKQYDQAVYYAQSVYRAKKKLGVDFSNGPCLTNDLLPEWVADIVHSPRESIDDLSENQCQAYLEGRAKHFVELDLDGNVVRVR
ncbi:hypothetical protein HYS93_04625 [Candidatus Daviesbacteria bacterium]|nr:hypothetical protein [Candidatus Daviesbacteria bacterium]